MGFYRKGMKSLFIGLVKDILEKLNRLLEEFRTVHRISRISDIRFFVDLHRMAHSMSCMLQLVYSLLMFDHVLNVR